MTMFILYLLWKAGKEIANQTDGHTKSYRQTAKDSKERQAVVRYQNPSFIKSQKLTKLRKLNAQSLELIFEVIATEL